MDDIDIIKRLGDLSAGNERRPNKMARFRAIYDAVEEALTRNSQQDVLAVLNDGTAGLGLSSACFKSYLQRMRRESSGGIQEVLGRSVDALRGKQKQDHASQRSQPPKPSMSEFLFPKRP